MRLNLGGLWRHPDFARLWAGETVSAFGSQISLLALPLTAVVVLKASADQMGFLTAAERLPFLVFGLGVGVWIDRRARRPPMIAADLGRALVLLVIPGAALAGALHIALLYAVAFLAGMFTLVFDVAYVAYLPSLVRQDQLVEGNGKLEASYSAAQAAGPGLGGLLVGLVTAPLAIALDALSYLVSALFLLRIRAPEPPVAPSGEAESRRVRHDIVDGLRAVFGDPILRGLAGCGVTTSVFGYAFLAIYVLYMARTLGLGPTTIGLILAAGGIGSLVGALSADGARRRLGVGPAIIWAQIVFALGGIAVPLAVVVPAGAVPLLAAAEAIQYGALAVYSVNQLSLRQTLAPPHLQGRVTATVRVLTTGGAAIGGLAGGVLGGAVGLGPTLVVATVGMMLAALWVVFSPLRKLRPLPKPDWADLPAADFEATQLNAIDGHSGTTSP